MKPLRILIVEDEPIIAMLFEELLSAMGCEVCAIEATEAGAVAAAARLHPDLMIVDGSLGRECGVAAVDTILDTGFIPHIFVSGDAGRILALKPGAIVIQKPFFEPELARAMERALASPA